ncbi:MAG: OmpA family protein [Chitinophagales bacterium]|nr:OmpA family protein [Bacteroidota bacterium]
MKTKIVYLLLLTFCLGFTSSIYAQKEDKKSKRDKKNSSVDVYANPGDDSKDPKFDKKYYNVEAKKYLKDWSLNVHFGATTPFTDIRSYDWARQFKKPSEIQWGAGIGLTKMFNSAFGLNIDYTLGKLLGRTVQEGGFAEERQYWKQLFPERTTADGPVYFKTSVFHQGSVNFYIDWLGLGMGYNQFIRSQITGKPVKSRKFAFYTKIGIGLIRTSSQIYNVKDDKPIANNAYLRGFTNKFTEIVFPLGFGMKFKLTKSFDLGIEGNFTFTNSDKLDAFQFQSRVDPGGKTINSLSKINRDAYAYMNVNFSYKFGRIGSQKEHVEWVNPIAFIMANQKQPDVNLKDTDKDGVLDILDKEPTTPAGYAVDAHGVTLDSDKDGCPDSIDPEPYSSPNYPIVDCKNVIPAPEVAKGTDSVSAPVVTKYDDTEIKKEINALNEKIWLLTSIYYDYDKSNITASASKELKKVGIIMATNPDLKVNVKGNTDTRGSEEYNQKLSDKRVDAAIKFLKDNYGISEDRFIKLPVGKTDPLVKDATTESQHHTNRRVDFYPAK